MSEGADEVLQRTTRGYQGQDVTFDIPVSAYRTRSGIIIVNSPGVSEPKDGRKDRYDTIARHLQAREMASFVTYNPPRPDAQLKYPDEPYSFMDASWNRVAVESMERVLDYALEQAESLCGAASPAVYLAGFSAGGSVCGAVAHRYPAVQRMLLMSAYDSVGDYFYDGIRGFTGDVYVAHGSLDPMAGFLAQVMPFITPACRQLQVRQVPDCDHGFRGAANSRVLSKAYYWAFFGDDSFPSPEGGLLLYDD